MSKIRMSIAIGDSIANVGNGVALVNPFIVYKTKYTPTMFSFAAIATISGYNAAETHTVELFLVKAADESDGSDESFDISQIKDSGKIQSTGKQPLPANLPLINFNLNWNLRNVPFENRGQYLVVLVFDNEHFEKPFFIESDKQLTIES